MSKALLGPVALALSVAFTMVPKSARASSELRVDGKYFKDAHGRVVVLRGVNVAGNAKVPPFRAITNPSLLDPLRTFGFNVVRLLFTWEAYEPEREQYDESYLDYIETTARAAGERGLYVVLDFHQDAFSRFSVGGCGDGFPAWAIPPNIARATPDNGSNCANWSTRMLTDLDMHASFGAFHRDEHGVRTRYLAMVERVARRLASNPAVVAYDMMNEPWGDEPTELFALHRDVGAAIRRVDPTAILFVSPHALISSGSKTNLKKPEFSNYVFSPHFYDASVLLFKTWLGNAPDGPFANMRSVADEWGVPLFVGEFGAPATTTNVAGYIQSLYDKLDETFASGAQWSYTPAWTAEHKDGWNDEDLSIVDDRGQLRANFRVRPYAQKIAGTPKYFKTTSETELARNMLDLEWEHALPGSATEIFVPRSEYFGTPNIHVDTHNTDVQCTAEQNRVRCTSASTGTKHVTIKASTSGPTPEPGGCKGDPSTLLLSVIALFFNRVSRRKPAQK